MQNERLYLDRTSLQVKQGAKVPPEALVHPATPFGERMLRVVLFWKDVVVANELFAPGSRICIGRSLKNDFVIPTIGLPASFELFRSEADGCTLRIPEAMTGLLQLKDKLQSIEEARREIGAPKADGGREVSLTAADRGVLEIGYIYFYFDFVPIPPELAREKPGDRVDALFVRIFMGMMILFLLFLILAQIFPPYQIESQSIENIPQRLAEEILQPQVLTPPPPVKLRLEDWQKKQQEEGKIALREKPQGKQGEGARREGKEGKRGKMSPSREGMVTQQRSVDQAGLLEVFSKSRKYSALSDILGGEGGGLANNLDKYFRPGGSTGKPGRWARGLKGEGLGGGGTARVGIGGLGTKGRGTGKTGYGNADVGTKGESAVTAVIEEGETYVMGSLDRQAILKVIVDNLGAIQYCYERQLTQQPNLGGKIVVNFVIEGSGRVTSSSVIQSNMGSKVVEDCVAARIRRLIFPKPPYGVVEVKFPFVFRSAG